MALVSTTRSLETPLPPAPTCQCCPPAPQGPTWLPAAPQLPSSPHYTAVVRSPAAQLRTLQYIEASDRKASQLSFFRNFRPRDRDSRPSVKRSCRQQAAAEQGWRHKDASRRR